MRACPPPHQEPRVRGVTRGRRDAAPGPPGPPLDLLDLLLRNTTALDRQTWSVGRHAAGLHRARLATLKHW